MSAITKKLQDLLGGVSQLPPEDRVPGTLDVLENALVSLTHGLRKRPPTETVGTVSATQAGYDTAFVHAIDRKDDEKYIVVVANGDLKVYDAATGTEQPVYFKDGKGYLTAGTRGFRAFTAGDHTFLVNRSTTVKRGGAKRSAGPQNIALIYVRQGDYATSYTVTINGESVTNTTLEEGISGARFGIATDQIASNLIHDFQTHTEHVKDEFSFTQLGSTIVVQRHDGGAFAISAYDGLSDKGLKIIQDKVEALEDLPARAVDGMVVEITGDPGSPKDNQWVTYEAGNPGVWRECPKPGVVLDLDGATMPHELVLNGKLTPLKHATYLHMQPSVQTLHGDEALSANGWTTDGSDVSINTDEGRDVEIDTDGGVIRSPAVGGTDAVLQRRVEIAFDVDLRQALTGARYRVTLQANTGAGGAWEDIDSRDYSGGTTRLNEKFIEHMVVPAGTRFGLKLDDRIRFGRTLPDSRRPHVVAHGSSNATPGILVLSQDATRINTWAFAQSGLRRDFKFPSGLRADFTIEGTTFSTTLTEDLSIDDFNQALADLVDADAGLSAAYDSSAFTGFPLVVGFDVTKASGGAASVTAASYTLPSVGPGAIFWNPDLTMTPGEHVGRTLQDVTTGCTGTIVANSATTVQVDTLQGGSVDDRLFREGDQCAVLGTGEALFVLQEAPWGQRLVGDDTLSPFPSFVDREISDVFFFAGRLGFTSEDRILLSAADDPYRFWRATVTQVLDDDPIDITSDLPDVGLLDSVVLWNGSPLLCSSAGHQIELTGEPNVTPATVKLRVLASYEQADSVRPLILGPSVIFPNQSSGYSHVREMFHTQDGQDTFSSRSLTGHVQKYIPGDVVDMTGDANLGFMALRASGDPTSLYIFNKVNPGTQQERHAWHRWTFGGNVVGIHFALGYLYLVVFRGGQVKLERINVAAPNYAAVHQDAGSGPYTFKARLNRHYLRDQNGVPVTHGRTQVRTLEVSHHDSGYYRVEVTPARRATKSYEVETGEGKKRVPVLAQNTAVTVDLLNDQDEGCAIGCIEWEATYSDRSGR